MPHNTDQLKVYALTRELVVAIHLLLDRHRQRMGAKSPTLRAQMLRAADAMLLNIAEGAGKNSDRSFAAFVDIAIGSANELDAQLDLAVAIGALPRAGELLREQTIEIRRMLIGLRKFLTRRSDRAGGAEGDVRPE